MADENTARWQGEVDTKLGAMTDSIDKLHRWAADHERLDGERFARLETLIDHDQEQKEQIIRLTHAIVGNGKDGLNVRTDRLEQSVGGIKKFLWLLLGAIISAAVTAAFAILL